MTFNTDVDDQTFTASGIRIEDGQGMKTDPSSISVRRVTILARTFNFRFSEFSTSSGIRMTVGPHIQNLSRDGVGEVS